MAWTPRAYDGFTRGDSSTLGSSETSNASGVVVPSYAWTEISGDLDIDTNRLGVVSGTSHGCIDPGIGSRSRIIGTLSGVVENSYVLFGYNSANGHFAIAGVYLGVASIWGYDGSSWTEVATGSAQSGTTIVEVRWNKDDLVSVLYDDTLEISLADMSAYSFGTGAGFYLTSTAHWGDSLAVEEMTAGPDTVTVQIVDEASPLADLTTAAWTDITTYVVDTIRVTRGRNSALQVTQPGRMSLEVKNYNGEFDPLTPAGVATFTSLRPRTPIRVQVQETDSQMVTTTHTVFVGYIDAWGSDYSQNHDQTVRLTATDMIGAVLPRLSELESEWAYQLRDGSTFSSKVAHWFRLGEAFTTTAYDQIGGEDANHTLASGGGVLVANQDPAERRSPPIVYGVQRASTRLRGDRKGASGGETHGIRFTEASAPGDRVYCYSFWVTSVAQIDQTTAPEQRILTRISTTPDGSEWLDMKGGTTTADWGKLEWHFGTSTTTDLVMTSSARIDDGQPHLVCMNRNGDSAALYIDGVLEVSTSSATSTWTGADTYFAIGGYGSSTAIHPINDMTFQDVVIWTQQLTATEIAYLYDIGSSPLGTPTHASDPYTNSHFAGNRVKIICDRIGLPTNMRTENGGAIEMTPAAWGNRTPLELLRETEASEHGLLYVKKNGVLRFEKSDWRTDNTLRSGLPQRKFTDDPTDPTDPVTHRFSRFTLHHGEDTIRTRARVPWSNGEIIDTANVTEYGDIELAAGAAIKNEAGAQTIADQILAEWSTPWPSATLEVDHDVQGDTYKALSETELFDRIVVSWNPTNGPGRYTAEWTVEAIDLEIGDGIAEFRGRLKLRLVEGTLLCVESDTIAADAFSRADSTSIGSTETGSKTWVNPTGWEIVDRRLEDVSATTLVPVLVDTGVDDVEVQVTWPEAARRRYLQLRGNSGGTAGIVVGWADDTTTTFEITIIGGSQLATATITGRDNDIVRAVVSSNTVTAYVDGIEVLTVTDAAIGSETGQHAGIRSISSARSLADSFIVNPA